MRIEAAKSARVRISDQGSEWRLTAPCPSCVAPLFVNVQPGPWRELADPAEAKLAGPDGHAATDPASFAMFEARRASDKLEHREVPTMHTQLWCFRCDAGVAVTVHAD